MESKRFSLLLDVPNFLLCGEKVVAFLVVQNRHELALNILQI
jgi:hypothetical protein